MQTATAAKTDGFYNLLHELWIRDRSICIGLDADPIRMSPISSPGDRCTRVTRLFQTVIDETSDLPIAYCLDTAFFEARGAAGAAALRNIIGIIHGRSPFLPIIVGGNCTNAESVFDYCGADAGIVNPLLAEESRSLFLNRPEKGVLVSCLASNPGADEFWKRLIYVDAAELQSLLPDEKLNARFPVAIGASTEEPGYLVPFYQLVALRVSRVWNKNRNCGLVVNATPQEIKAVRNIAPEMPILVTARNGLNGDLGEIVGAGKNKNGHGIIINCPLNMIVSPDSADSGPAFAKAVRAEVQRLTKLINKHLTA